MRRTIIFTFYFLIGTFSAYSHVFQNYHFTKNDTTKLRSKYIIASPGIGSLTFRDFATSPHFYDGMLLSMGIGNENHHPHREISFLMLYSQASTSMSFNGSSGFSNFKGIDFQWHYLRNIKKISTPKWAFYTGGGFFINNNIRQNPSLGNNGFGYENISNLNWVNKVKWDISRKESRVFKAWFIKKNLKPRIAQLNALFHCGILNNNLRPGYAYQYFSEIDGTNGGVLNEFRDNYRWSINGWRLATEINYTHFLFNGNGIRFSYVWDAMHAPGRFEAFQMASHRFQVSLMFNTK